MATRKDHVSTTSTIPPFPPTNSFHHSYLPPQALSISIWLWVKGMDKEREGNGESSLVTARPNISYISFLFLLVVGTSKRLTKDLPLPVPKYKSLKEKIRQW